MFVGNSHIVSFFDRSLAMGDFSHAYLFVGPRSVGKTAFALRLAQILQKKHAQALPNFLAQEKECTCSSCAAIVQGSHPDVHVIEEQLTIEKTRSLKKELAQSPLVSPYHIVIIANIQTASREAMQALLKLLEEPSASTLLVLTAENLSSVPSTIVSRSSVLHFSFVSEKEMRNLFISPQQKNIQELIPYWRGRPGRLVLLLGDYALVTSATAEKLRAENFLQKPLAERFSLARQFASLDKTEALASLEEWMVWWRERQAFQPLAALASIHQKFLNTPITIQTSLEYLALYSRKITIR